MFLRAILRWPNPMYMVLGLLIVASSTIFLWFLVFEDSPAYWSRKALNLQVIVLFFAALLLPLRPPGRLFIYPLILLVVMYLWDMTLPPPNLPEGLIRAVFPRLALLGLMVDFFSMLRRRQMLW